MFEFSVSSKSFKSEKISLLTAGLPGTMLNRVSEFAFCFLRDNQNTSGNRGYRLFFFISDTAKSQARAVSAMYVSDGFTQEEDTMHAPSVRNRFLASCA